MWRRSKAEARPSRVSFMCAVRSSGMAVALYSSTRMIWSLDQWREGGGVWFNTTIFGGPLCWLVLRGSAPHAFITVLYYSSCLLGFVTGVPILFTPLGHSSGGMALTPSLSPPHSSWIPNAEREFRVLSMPLAAHSLPTSVLIQRVSYAALSIQSSAAVSCFIILKIMSLWTWDARCN